MRRLQVILAGFALAIPAVAQETPARIQGYGYFGVLGDNGTTFGKLLEPGLGADVFLYRGLAAGADIGYVGYYSDFRAAGLGVVSPNLSYQFFRSRTFVPFVTGGYSLEFRNGTANLGNYGAGFTYWFVNHAGLRIEARDYWGSHGYHMGGLQFGVSFR